MDPILEQTSPITESEESNSFVLKQEDLDIARENIEGNIGKECRLVTMSETKLIDSENGMNAFVVGEFKDKNNIDDTWICLVGKSQNRTYIYSSNLASDFLNIKVVKERIEQPILNDVLRYGLAIEDLKNHNGYVLLPDLQLLEMAEYEEIFEDN